MFGRFGRYRQINRDNKKIFCSNIVWSINYDKGLFDNEISGSMIFGERLETDLVKT